MHTQALKFVLNKYFWRPIYWLIHTCKTIFSGKLLRLGPFTHIIEYAVIETSKNVQCSKNFQRIFRGHARIFNLKNHKGLFHRKIHSIIDNFIYDHEEFFDTVATCKWALTKELLQQISSTGIHIFVYLQWCHLPSFSFFQTFLLSCFSSDRLLTQQWERTKGFEASEDGLRSKTYLHHRNFRHLRYFSPKKSDFYYKKRQKSRKTCSEGKIQENFFTFYFLYFSETPRSKRASSCSCCSYVKLLSFWPSYKNFC